MKLWCLTLVLYNFIFKIHNTIQILYLLPQKINFAYGVITLQCQKIYDINSIRCKISKALFRLLYQSWYFSSVLCNSQLQSRHNHRQYFSFLRYKICIKKFQTSSKIYKYFFNFYRLWWSLRATRFCNISNLGCPRIYFI